MAATTHDTDEQLVARLANDDNAAFTVLFDRYWQRLLIKARTSLCSEAEAEEIVQTVFLNLWRRRKSIQLKNSFHTYISASVKYEIIDTLASSSRRRQVHLTAHEFSTNIDKSTIAWIDYENTRNILEQTVRQLPEKCQLVFRLSREAGLSESEIANELGISVKTVGAHKTKALKAIRNALHQLLF